MIMKTKYILKGIIATLLLTFFVSSCENYNEELLDGIGAHSEFSPIGLKAIIRNQTTVELNWTVSEDADHYVVEFSADDPNFNTIFKTVEATGAELPLLVPLEGETLYSIRVKAVSSTGLDDSKWSVTTAQTLSEQIFFPLQPEDVEGNQATFKWPANSNVTQIVITPGDITHEITPQEKIDGMATVTGLTGDTDYTAVLLNNTKTRGTLTFTTGVDVSTGTLVSPTDDLFQMVANAAPGSILILEAGDYTAQTGIISLNKSITIRGLKKYNKPLLKVSFSIKAGTVDVALWDLDLTGSTPTVVDVVRYSEAGDYGSLLIRGCNIHNYDRSLVAGNVVAKVVAVTIDNCIVTNVITNGGDLIDFRATYVGAINVTNSTFNNCAATRDFFRVDAGSLTGTGLTTNVVLDSCTLYAVSNTATKRILYVRFNANAIIVRNNLFADTVAIYSNQSTTSAPTFLNNNYFNAEGLHTTNPVFDGTTNFTTLNPQFANTATGDFTLGNQNLIDNNIGDPRWR